ncbi:PREDICTED: methionine-R-sulfoxide reductase B3 [Galeopterus variegatus]|uniref:L-methionine (R)-S-oxide reductase n=1 Tax=Galeopterus variegatus TaxID=482537 RepID=A0ABM0RPY9_GALVR|nr:PREDICTED: methionine-R-sulfoxide reductase B3 [Galeopterus variegatus]
MSAFNLLHLVTKNQPVALRACGLPSGSCRDKKNCKVVFSQQELRKRLTPLQYHVTQEKGTESAFEGEYTHHKDPGIYKCVVCGTPLFKNQVLEKLCILKEMGRREAIYPTGAWKEKLHVLQDPDVRDGMCDGGVC